MARGRHRYRSDTQVRNGVIVITMMTLVFALAPLFV